MHGSSIVAFWPTEVCGLNTEVPESLAYRTTKLAPTLIESYDEDKYCCRLTSLVFPLLFVLVPNHCYVR